MICRPCATGADLATDARRFNFTELEDRYPGLNFRQAVADAHDQCSGCDCQHKINLDGK